MSTRAGIIVKDKFESIHFYRHSDGYPEGTLPTLEKFLNLVKEKKIRNNASQASGWLIMIGAQEYSNGLIYGCPKCKTELKGEECPKCGGELNFFEKQKDLKDILNPSDNDVSGWKVGAYEPTRNVYKHGDLDYIYTIDLEKLEITYKRV